MESDVYLSLNKNCHHKTVFQADKVLPITIETWFTVKFDILEKNGVTHSQVLFKVSALKYFRKFTVKHLCHRWIMTQKMTFSFKDFFSKCDQIGSFLRIWSHLKQINKFPRTKATRTNSPVPCPFSTYLP